MLMISSLDSPPVLVEVAKQASFGGRKMSNEGNRNGKSREATKRKMLDETVPSFRWDVKAEGP